MRRASWRFSPAKGKVLTRGGSASEVIKRSGWLAVLRNEVLCPCTLPFAGVPIQTFVLAKWGKREGKKRASVRYK